VRRILVVANQTLGGDHLAEVIRARVVQGPTEVLLLVPATHHTDLLMALAEAFAVQGGMRPPAPTDDADGAARDQAAAGVSWLTGLGVSATAEVVGHDPVQEIRELLARAHVDEVIVSTLPAGMSRWLHQDLAHRIRRATEAPVTVVTAEPPDAAAGAPAGAP
jgi:GABA permease